MASSDDPECLSDVSDVYRIFPDVPKERYDENIPGKMIEDNAEERNWQDMEC